MQCGKIKIGKRENIKCLFKVTLPVAIQKQGKNKSLPKTKGAKMVLVQICTDKLKDNDYVA